MTLNDVEENEVSFIKRLSRSLDTFIIDDDYLHMESNLEFSLRKDLEHYVSYETDDTQVVSHEYFKTHIAYLLWKQYMLFMLVKKNRETMNVMERKFNVMMKKMESEIKKLRNVDTDTITTKKIDSSKKVDVDVDSTQVAEEKDDKSTQIHVNVNQISKLSNTSTSIRVGYVFLSFCRLIANIFKYIPFVLSATCYLICYLIIIYAIMIVMDIIYRIYTDKYQCSWITGECIYKD